MALPVRIRTSAAPRHSARALGFVAYESVRFVVSRFFGFVCLPAIGTPLISCEPVSSQDGWGVAQVACDFRSNGNRIRY